MGISSSDNMALRWLILACCVLLASAAVTSRKTKWDPWMTPQPNCTKEASCYPPDCMCASTRNPLDDDEVYIPQFVILSFDDAVKVDNYDFYDNLIDSYINPNGCPITMTYFITHMYNDYSLTNELHRRGSEIAAHSVSHKPDVQNYWKPMDYDTWFKEINDAKSMINKYGKIPLDDIKGWRAPFLETGGDIMYKAMHDAGFTYDCSISTYRYSNWYTIEGEDKPRGALFPYTMDYESDLKCSVGKCPKETYPGFWVTPMTDLDDPRSWTNETYTPEVKVPCNMLGSCIQGNETDTEWDCIDDECKDNMVQWLKDSFAEHYDKNKAPFGLYTHYAWLQNDDIQKTRRKEAYMEFLEYLQGIEDVWIVSLSTLVEWMKDPQYQEDMIIGGWEPASCNNDLPDTNCQDPIVCSYENPPFGGSRVEMTICTRPCPDTYPWLDNVDG